MRDGQKWGWESVLLPVILTGDNFLKLARDNHFGKNLGHLVRVVGSKCFSHF